MLLPKAIIVRCYPGIPFFSWILDIHYDFAILHINIKEFNFLAFNQLEQIFRLIFHCLDNFLYLLFRLSICWQLCLNLFPDWFLIISFLNIRIYNACDDISSFLGTLLFKIIASCFDLAWFLFIWLKLNSHILKDNRILQLSVLRFINWSSHDFNFHLFFRVVLDLERCHTHAFLNKVRNGGFISWIKHYWLCK